MRVLWLALVLLISALGSGPAASAEMEWRFPSDRITLRQWSEFRDEVLAKPGIRREEFANQLVLASVAERRIYVFTTPGHPAHPAVVVRVVLARGTGSAIRRMGHYGGSKSAFDKWWHEFDELDARMPGRAP